MIYRIKQQDLHVNPENILLILSKNNVRIIAATLLLIVCILPSRAQVQPHVTVPQDLGGLWRFALDRNDEGVTQQWFSVRLPQFIKLPGILQDQKQGEEISTKTP